MSVWPSPYPVPGSTWSAAVFGPDYRMWVIAPASEDGEDGADASSAASVGGSAAAAADDSTAKANRLSSTSRYVLFEAVDVEGDDGRLQLLSRWLRDAGGGFNCRMAFLHGHPLLVPPCFKRLCWLPFAALFTTTDRGTGTNVVLLHDNRLDSSCCRCFYRRRPSTIPAARTPSPRGLLGGRRALQQQQGGSCDTDEGSYAYINVSASYSQQIRATFGHGVCRAAWRLQVDQAVPNSTRVLRCEPYGRTGPFLAVRRTTPCRAVPYCRCTTRRTSA